MSQQTASPALSKLGNEIVARMAHEVVTGASLVRLQLLASQFYEAMKADIEQTPHEPARIGALTSAADRCRRSAENCLSPHLMLVEIRAAVAMLSAPPVAYQTDTVVRFRPPQLRVIQGGLA